MVVVIDFGEQPTASLQKRDPASTYIFVSHSFVSVTRPVKVAS